MFEWWRRLVGFIKTDFYDEVERGTHDIYGNMTEDFAYWTYDCKHPSYKRWRKKK